MSDEKLELEIKKLRDQKNQLRGALNALVNGYIANINSESEFIKCITPKSASQMSFFERRENKCWNMWDNARVVLEKTA